MLKMFAIIFWSVFLAEIGDKTQLATLLFSTDQKVNKWLVFAASSTALTCSSLIAVLLGQQLTHWVNPKTLKLIAGLGFVAIGIFLSWESLKG
ncbi:MAG: TMEM165/GDT1 family protein [Acidobacteria bacterium]|nr:TMEM165/GDT1 family protein [Acidobacteriota bacterium]MCB9398820.1 TMEM165/GDT1 family protein [Acidobacteriota bacterium]